MANKVKVSEITLEEELEMKKKSPYNMPNNPSEKGMKASEIRNMFTSAYLGSGTSLLTLMKRIISEQNDVNRNLYNSIQNLAEGGEPIANKSCVYVGENEPTDESYVTWYDISESLTLETSNDTPNNTEPVMCLQNSNNETTINNQTYSIIENNNSEDENIIVCLENNNETTIDNQTYLIIENNNSEDENIIVCLENNNDNEESYVITETEEIIHCNDEDTNIIYVNE